jgi:hypothetical protein
MQGQELAIALEFYLPLAQEEDCERCRGGYASQGYELEARVR